MIALVLYIQWSKSQGYWRLTHLGGSSEIVRQTKGFGLADQGLWNKVLTSEMKSNWAPLRNKFGFVCLFIILIVIIIVCLLSYVIK